MTAIYVDGDACPVREEVFRVADRLGLTVFVVSNGSRPIRPSGRANVRMITVPPEPDAADNWIAQRITPADVCVTTDIPLAARCLTNRARGTGVKRQAVDGRQYRQRWPVRKCRSICARWGVPTGGPAPITK
jgi:uncharacterized protein YaiI (UPF0178 family)